MPTRIVLDTNPVPSQLSPKRQIEVPRNSDVLDGRKRSIASGGRTSLARRSTGSGFRSSILRELSVRQDSGNGGADDEETQRIRISSGDIRASPRFLGYLFAAITGSVLLVSTIQFYKKEILPDGEEVTSYNTAGNETAENGHDEFYRTDNDDLIYKWKLWGAIYCSSALVGVSFLVMILHYDTVCFPKLWIAVFRDGSLAERNFILIILTLWMGAIHTCTSSLSVGAVQANVYFTSWIAFGSIALTWGVWRESAGLPTITDMMNQHKRETTYNWIWIMIFSIVVAGAATDIYYNRSEIELRYEGEIVDLQQNNWILVLTLLWGDVAVCILTILCNEYWIGSTSLPHSCKWCPGCGCLLEWRQIEGLIMLAGVAWKFYIIWEFTGVDGVVNGLSNAYFGIWGSFFNSVFALGTWLKEKQNTEYIAREENADTPR